MSMPEKVRNKAFELHLEVAALYPEIKKKCEAHFTWLQEVLIEAKKSFASPEVHLLPKTPSVKRTRQMRRAKNEDGTDGSAQSKPRRTRKGKATTDSKSDSTDNGSQRATRSTRATRATAKSATSKVQIKAEAEDSESGSQSNLSPVKLEYDTSHRSPLPTNSPRLVKDGSSPRGIPGFTTLNVKEKASAYEEYVSSPKKIIDGSKTTSSTSSPRRQNVISRVLDSLRKSNSPRTSPRGSPVRKNNISCSPKPVKMMTEEEPVIMISEEESVKMTGEEYEDVEGEEERRVARPRRSSRRSSARVVSKPLGMKTPVRRRSSIMKDSLYEKKLPKPSSIKRTPSKLRKPTPAPMTLGSSDIPSGTTSSADQEEETQSQEECLPKPKPRSKPRHPPPTSTDTSDEDEEGAAGGRRESPPKRTTRSKVRQPKPAPIKLAVSSGEGEVGSGDADVEDEDEDMVKTPTPAPRTTRSKMRLNKAAPPKLPAPSTDEEATPTNKRQGPKIVKPSSPSSGSKRPKANTEYDVPPAKKRCKEEYESADSDGMVIDKTPSPPRNKILRGGGGGQGSAQSSHTYSFLSQLKKNHTPSHNGTITSFIKRNTPIKSSLQVREMQKRKDVEAKTKEMEHRVNKRQELLQQKAEEQRRRREERQALAAKRREENQRRIQESQRETLMKQDEKRDIKSRLLEEKQKEERERQKVRDKKLVEAELRRKQEEETRLQRLREADAENKKLEEMQQRKKEFEEAERQKRIAEQRKVEEEKRMERERQREQEDKQRQELEEKQRQAMEERRQREEALNRERQEREQRELEEKRERERKRMEQLDLIRMKERERLQQLVQQQAAQQEKQRAVASTSATAGHNTSSQVAKQLNTTVTKEPASDSYEITPVKAKLKSTPENYNIKDIESEDSTDDEDAPKKSVPAWANGANLKAALISQFYRPPDLDNIFGDISGPDLNMLFKRKKARFNKRTSSACWDSPMYKASGAPSQ